MSISNSSIPGLSTLSSPASSPLLHDTFDLAHMEGALAGTLFAGRVQHFAEVASTNTLAMRAGAGDALDGSVYVTDAQTGGRGRGAHSWSSPAGSGLYVSILLRPHMAPGDALWLSLAAGLAARNAVHTVAGFAPDLRWPNDLLVGKRKLGGVLTEMQAEVTRVRFVVIGIGINVHQREFPPELAGAATSLALEAPQAAVTRMALLVALLRALHEEVEALAGEDPAGGQIALVNRLEAGSTWMRGKRVIVGKDGKEQPVQGVVPAVVQGVTEGLDARGFLRVRAETGKLHTVLSGDVREWE